MAAVKMAGNLGCHTYALPVGIITGSPLRLSVVRASEKQDQQQVYGVVLAELAIVKSFLYYHIC